MRKVLPSLTLVLSILAFQVSFASGIIKLQNGNVHTTENTAQFIADAENLTLPVHEGNYHLLIQFQEIPSQAERNLFEETGLSLIEYLPDNTYIAQVPAEYDLSQLLNFNIRFVGPVPKALTMHPELYQEVYPAHAMVGTHRIRLQILPYRNQDPELIKEALLDFNVDVFKDPHYPEKISIEADLQDIEALATAPFTFFLAPIDVEPYLENYTSRTSHRSNAVDNYLPGGDRFDGTGINVGLQDDGFIGPHIDYQGRLVHFTATNGGNHGDHVAGTIMGAGNLNPRHKGMAPGVTIKVGYYFQINGNMTNYYNNDSIYITSASLGATCNGGYDGNAVTRDQQINSLPHLMHVFSAGNSQSSNCGYGAGSGWGTITGGHKQAKNLIAVGALDDNDGMSGYSSWGPAADGRLKPEVSARGSSVISTGTGNNYYTASGTSMACPGTSGALAQLYHAYRELNAQAFPPSELLKAIMMNCAEDLGNPGPDYKFGYGRVNNRRSLEVLKNNWYTSNSISQGGSNTFNITIPANSSQLRVMVYWHDYEGTPGASQALVNNLDMTVTNPSAITFQPWILDPTPNATNLDANATRGVDNLNNHEQVTIDNPASGTYTVTVSGTAVPQGPQDYVLVYYIRPDTIALTYPLGGEPFEVNTTEKIRWDALGTSGNFTLEYSTDNGSSWNNISSSIPGTRRYYDWSVPNVVTAQAKIRISRSGLVTASDSFSIIDVPTNLSMSDKCAGIGTLTWNAVPGADAYDVFALGNKYMDSIGTTTATFFDVQGLSIGGTNWYSVRARTNSGAVGMRAVAIEYTHNGAGVCFPIDLAATNLISPAAGCGLTNSETVAIEVRNQGSDSIPAGTPVSIWYQLNGGSVVSQTVNLSAQLNSGSSTTLTFSTPGDFSAQSNLISYWVNVAGDPFQLNDTVNDFGLINLPLVNTYPYLEDFEADTGGWYSIGGLWEWGSPNGPSINTNAPNGVNSWMTDLDANYPDNALAFVQSPCFDFSALTNPWIRLDINVASEFSWDGAILQASTNSGTTWSTVGAFGDPGNWYNDNTVFALSGLDPSEEGWTGSSGGWLSATNALTGLGGNSNVWLRIAFASDGAAVADGIAFDNVEIFEPLSDDVTLTAINDPVTSACLTSTEAVELSIFNSGSLSQNFIPVVVEVTGPINSGILRDTITSNISSGNSLDFSFGPTVDLSAQGTYTITAWTELAGDQDVSNDTFTTTVTSIAPISSFPWTEDFESFSICGNSNVCNVGCVGAVANNWSQDDGDQQDWRVDDGATASNSTGPSQDYDPGNINGKYIYTEASGGCTQQTMNMVSPCFDMSVLSNPRVSFFYHMYGATTGSLHLDITTNNGVTWTNLWSLSGQQQTSSAAAWRTDTVDISAYSGTIRFRFRGVTGNDFTSDMAIDAVTIFDVIGADVGVSAVNAPSNGTCLSNAESIDLSLQNFGSLSQSNIPVAVSITGPINSGILRDTFTASLGSSSSSGFAFGPTADLSAPGTYTITAWTSLPGDGNLTNDTLITTVVNGNGISSFPWTEDFESFNICGNANSCGLVCAAAVANGWYQDDNDQQDWRVDEGTTASPNTGPSQDHDPGTSTGNYIYTEASNGCGNQTSNIVTPCFNLDSLSDGRFSFFYHMYGVSTGTINVDISLDNGATWTNLRTISGQQQSNSNDPWLGDTIDISGYSGLARFRFNGTTGPNFESDMAIDAVQIFSDPTIPQDVGVSAITSPSSGACGNASATVSITVNNFGAGPVSNIPVEFNVTGTVNTTTISETVTGPIGPAGSTTYSFVLPASLSAQGTYTVTAWTALATDVNVNNDTTSATVTIQDNTDPSISCPANVNVGNTPGSCGAIVSYSAPTATDNCSGVTTQQIAGLASGSIFPIGATINTFVATDVAGNTDTCSFTVTVSDTEDPVISCTGNIAAGNNVGTCGALITYPAPSFTDNCPGGSITQIAGLSSGSIFPIGVTTNTFVATDAAGNADTCSFTVTISDTEDPVVTGCPSNIAASNTPGTCGAVVNYSAPSFTDNCAGGSISRIAGLSSGTTFPVGVTTNIFVATDAAGNSDTCSFTVTITDTDDPVISCIGNITTNNDAGVCGAVVNFAAPTFTDNCAGGSINQIAGLSSGSTFPVGVTTNTFVATDAVGNADTCSFTVTVSDNEAPVISCPGNFASGTDLGTCGAVVNYAAPTFTDNCAGGTVSQIAGLSSGSTFPLGVTTNTFVATDAAGNADTCSFTVTVSDNEIPTVNCVPNITVNAAPGNCNAVVTFGAITASDNCPGATVSQIAGLSSGSTFPLGVTTNTFRATDASSNTNTCSFTVTVIPSDTVVAAFTFSPSTLTVNFTNQSQDASSYAWDFGDGAISAATNPSHTYGTPGTYAVQLIAFGACENDTTTVNVTVSATSNNWTGAIDSSWSNPGNWSLGTVPNGACLEIDIMIPSGAPNMPVVDANIGVNKITVMAGAQLMIADNDTLGVCGNITYNGVQNMGNGTLWINGTSPQQLSGQLVVETVVMDNASGLNLQAGSRLALRYALVMVQGDIDVPGSAGITLRSRPSRTAYLDDFTFPSAGAITDGAGDGNITMERWVINPVNALHFISSAVEDGDVSGWANDFTITGPNNAQVIPLPNCDPNNLAPNSPYGELFEYREWRVNNCSFEGWFVRSADSLGHGQGFSGIIPNNTLIDLTGVPGSGPVSFGPITRSTGNTTTVKGMNTLGNPYPSAISWPALQALNPSLGGTAYLWQSSGYYGGTLQPMSALLPGNNIASSQAFQVEVLGPAPQSINVQFDNSIRRAGDPTFQLTGGTYDQRVDLVVEGNGFADKTHVLFLNGATNGWDGQMDGRKRPSLDGQPTLFSYIGTEIMSINARPDFNNNGASVPVGFIPGDSARFDIRLDVEEGFPFGTLILLEDKQEGVMHNLLDQPTYSFSSDTSDLHDRFVLHFTPPVEFNLTEESCNGEDGAITVDMGSFGQGAWLFTWDSVVVSGSGNSSTVAQANQVQNFANLPQGNYQVSFHLGAYSLDTVLNLTGKQRVEAGFSVSKLLLQVGEFFTLNDLSSGATLRQWNMDDGTIISNQSTATHSYSLDGSYTIRQDVNNNDCAADTSIEVQVLKNTTGVEVIEGVQFLITSDPGILQIKVDGNMSAAAEVSIYDVQGGLVDEFVIHGDHIKPWDYAQSYYIIRLKYGNKSISRRILFR